MIYLTFLWGRSGECVKAPDPVYTRHFSIKTTKKRYTLLSDNRDLVTLI